MKAQTKVLIASGVALAATAALAGGVDQGSVARTIMPRLRAPRGANAFSDDVEYLRQAVRRHEIGVTKAQRQRFNAVLDRRPVETVDQLTLAASEALGCFENAATTVLTTSAHRLGVRFAWVSDALVVVRARPELSHLLGERVLRIAGGEPGLVWPMMRPWISGGSEGWVRNRSAWFFSVPEALRQLGFRVGDGVRLETESRDGTHATTLLQAESHPTPGGPLTDFRDRFPTQPEASGGWRSALVQGASTPIYLRDPETLLLTEELPWRGETAAYVRLFGTADGRDPLGREVEDAVAWVEGIEPGIFVVDVRYHSGGDYRVTLPLVRAVSERARALAVPIRLLVGPNTIGGGLVSASQYLVHAPERTTIVGREAGEGLRERGQGRTLVLPHSGLKVQLCHDWHDVSSDPMPWHDVWLPDKFLLLGVDDFRPQIGVQNSWLDYLDGHDRVLETALDYR